MEILTIWQWVQAMWHELWPWWVLGALCWLAVTVDWVDRHVAAKKAAKGKISIKIQIPVRYEEETETEPDQQPHLGTEESMGGLQPVC